MEEAMIHPGSRLSPYPLAALLVMLGLAPGDAEAARRRPPAIVSATTGEETVTVRGSGFGEETPRVTLGSTELLILSHGPSEIVARLPEMPPGSYRLLVRRPSSPGDSAAFIITLGAVGPAGSQGAPPPMEAADDAATTSLARTLRRGAASCYRHWGGTTCLSGYDATLTGRPGGIESYSTGGALYGNVECVSGSATPTAVYAGTYQTRLMRSDTEGDGMQAVDNSCAICCRGGCYTALGTDTCAPGYSTAYTGRVGGVEAYASAQIQGQTLCIDSSATPSFTWASGYSTRLMRHRAPVSSGGANGVEVISGLCAVCCKP
jgi:hypothetical protein